MCVCVLCFPLLSCFLDRLKWMQFEPITIMPRSKAERVGLTHEGYFVVIIRVKPIFSGCQILYTKTINVSLINLSLKPVNCLASLCGPPIVLICCS